MSKYLDTIGLATVADKIAEKYATKEAINGKQNTLTAGTNIRIENDVISATGESEGLGEDTIFWGQTASNGAVSGDITLTQSSPPIAGCMIYSVATNTAYPYLNIGATGNRARIRLGKGTESAFKGLDMVLKNATGNYESTFTGPLAMSSNKIAAVADPTDAQDAATKNYVDTAISAIDLSDYMKTEDMEAITDSEIDEILT